MVFYFHIIDPYLYDVSLDCNLILLLFYEYNGGPTIYERKIR